MGRQGLAGFVRMLMAIQAGDWGGAKFEALESDWAKQTPGRAAEVAEMLYSGQFPPEG